MKKKLTFEEARTEVKDRLPDFLEAMNVKGNKQRTMYQCFYPDHNDHSPSLHVFKSYNGETMYHCMGCHRTGDIFMANNVLQNKSLLGYDFLTNNMKDLAEQFNIEGPLLAVFQAQTRYKLGSIWSPSKCSDCCRMPA